jgi:site-specific recombinase XerD
MKNHNPNNERIKRKYLVFIKEAKRQNEATVDAIAKALSRFEEYTKYRDFKAFHYEQAIAFKKFLSNQKNRSTGKNLSKATLNTTLGHLKRFFQWLSEQPGYKSRISYSEAEYFNLSEKDIRVATAQRPKSIPSLEQIRHVISSMPDNSDIALRNRAIIAFIILTGARDSAVASMKLKHIDLTTGCIFQDAREVRTKFSKTFKTYFFPVGNEILLIFEKWVAYLKEKLLYSHDDPLFPSTEIALGDNKLFKAAGLTYYLLARS